MPKRTDSLAVAFPHLVAEWHLEKNGALQPTDVAPFSHKKCWWKCSLGHEYSAIVEHRSRGQGCPYCSNHKVWPGFNDFATQCPEILKEWNWSKNENVLPSQVARLSSYNAWWRCELGHEYQMPVRDKVSNKYGCPICSGKRVLAGFNDLATVRPEIAKQWDVDKNNGLKPSDVTYGSHKKVWWKCKNGHSWLMPINARLYQNCPYCSGKKVWPRFNDFASRHPELLAYWDQGRNGDLSPEDVSYGSSRRVWWKCEHGHSYDMTVEEKHRGYGCPICSVARLTDENNLAARHPDLMKEWDYAKNAISPTDISSYSKIAAWWVCPRGHSYKMTPCDRVAGHGCPQCNLTRRTSFFEQAIAYYLKRTFEVDQRVRIAGREIDIYLPDINLGIEYDGAYFHAGEAAKRREEKKNAALRDAGVRLIRVKESLDKECREGDVIYHKASFKFKALSFVMTHLASILSEIAGRELTFNVNVEKDKGDIVASYEVDREDNSLASLYPKVAAKWNYAKNGESHPRMFTAKSGHRVWWKCPTCGNEWYGPIEHQTNGLCSDNDFCPRCIRVADKARLVNGYSLQALYPHLAKEWNVERNALSASDVTPGSKKVVWWRCSLCGKEWQSKVIARTKSGICGCRKCKLKCHREEKQRKKSCDQKVSQMTLW